MRGFTQDDAHLFCRPDQLCDEIRGVINFAIFMLKSFGFSEYEVFLSTGRRNQLEPTRTGRKPLQHLKEALVSDLKYQIDPGEGGCSGPKIDIKLKDALGRLWRGPTIRWTSTSREVRRQLYRRRRRKAQAYNDTQGRARKHRDSWAA